MCGRIVSSSRPEQLALVFEAALEPDVDSCECGGYNVPPTRPVLAVSAAAGTDHRRWLGCFRWGMGRTSPVSPGRPADALFNARAETVASRPAFRRAFASRRVLVLADGFYEWERGPGGQRQPHYFHRADGQPMAMAGLWEPAAAAPSGARPTGVADLARSCAVITTSANEDMGGTHDRMPVVLEPEAFDIWLDPANHDVGELEAVVGPGRAGTIVHHPVSTRVGDVRNDDPSLLERVQPVVPGTLFG